MAFRPTNFCEFMSQLVLWTKCLFFGGGWLLIFCFLYWNHSAVCILYCMWTYLFVVVVSFKTLFHLSSSLGLPVLFSKQGLFKSLVHSEQITLRHQSVGWRSILCKSTTWNLNDTWVPLQPSTALDWDTRAGKIRVTVIWAVFASQVKVNVVTDPTLVNIQLSVQKSRCNRPSAYSCQSWRIESI